jgi:tRNA(Ile)-lysidine synthase
MLEHIETILRDQCGLSKDRLIIVGVSGGPDSLCLMESLRQAGYPILVAHFNHRLRPESEAEATLVEQTAARLMVPSIVESADVRLYAEGHGMSLEESARHLRYTYLFEQARQRGAQAIAVGHTADDQVETVLMHFLRGAGLTGLKGMSHRTRLPAFEGDIPLVRPLLDVWREETVVYCAANGLRPIMDPSNDSLNFTRNRLRKLLIPTLETYNPKFREAVWRSVQTLKADHVLLRETVEAAWKESVTAVEPSLVVFDIAQLAAWSHGLQRNLIRLAVERLQPGQETNFAMLSRATALIGGMSGARVDLAGGLNLYREGSSLYVCTSEADLPFDKWPQMPEDSGPLSLTIPGGVEISGGWKLSCESWRLPALAREQAERNEDPFQVWLDAESLPASLELRMRHPGDRFEPLGMDGHSQKLSDFLVNEKMPRRARDRWPMLCSGEKVIWVPGYRPAHPYRLHAGSRKILYFALARPPQKNSTGA